VGIGVAFEVVGLGVVDGDIVCCGVDDEELGFGVG